MERSEGARVAVLGKLGGTGLLLVGLASVVAAGSFLLRSSVAPNPSNLARPSPRQAQPAHDFQLIQLGDMRRDQFLLDKRTGRVWDSVCNGQVSGPNCNGAVMWQEMHVDGIEPATTGAAPESLQQLLQGGKQR